MDSFEKKLIGHKNDLNGMNLNIKRTNFLQFSLTLSRKKGSIEKSGNKQLRTKMAGTMWSEILRKMRSGEILFKNSEQDYKLTISVDNACCIC